MSVVLTTKDFLSPSLRELKADARLCWMGLRMMADSEGDVRFNPESIIEAVFPAGDIDGARYAEMLAELQSASLISAFDDKITLAGIKSATKKPSKPEQAITAETEEPTVIKNLGLAMSEQQVADAVERGEGLELPIKAKGMAILITNEAITAFEEKWSPVPVRQEIKSIALWNNDYPEKRKTAKGAFRHVNSWLKRASTRLGRSGSYNRQPDSRVTAAVKAPVAQPKTAPSSADRVVRINSQRSPAENHKSIASRMAAFKRMQELDQENQSVTAPIKTAKVLSFR